MTSADTLERATQAGIEYNRCLLRANNLTVRLVDALGRSDTDAAANLLEARARACDEIARCAKLLESLAERSSSHAQTDLARYADLKPMVEQIRAGLRSLLEKQAACEDALQARLDECRTDLTTLRRRRGLRRAYGKQSPGRDSRFLDSKL